MKNVFRLQIRGIGVQILHFHNTHVSFLNVATFKNFIGRIKKILTINVYNFHKYILFEN
jgi:hypothetical protein